MIKEILTKYLSQVLMLATVLGLGYFAYTLFQKSQRAHEDLIGTKEKYEQLTRYTAKLETDYKNQKDLVAQVDKKWKEVVRTQEERIQLLSDATYLIGKHSDKQDGPDYYFQTTKGTRNYVFNEVRIAGPDSPPIGFVMIKNDGRTYKGNYEFQIVIRNLQTVDETTGKIKVYSKAFLVAQENGLAEKRKPDFKKWKGAEYPLPIVDGVALVDPTTPSSAPDKFMWWAPHLNGGSNLGLDSEGLFFRPEFNFSISGYGKSRNDLSWKFFQPGVGIDTQFKNPDLHFIVFTYRFFQALLTNTYIGPGLGVSKNGLEYFGNVSVGF